MKTVAHCATPFLPDTATWLYHQIVGQRRVRVIVLTQEHVNADRFPLSDGAGGGGGVYAADARSAPFRLVNRLSRGVTREMPFYTRILRREGVSLIHAHFGHHACRCLRARRVSGLPMVTSFYGADATRFARIRRWQRRYGRLFDQGQLFLAEGSAMAAQLERIGCPADKIRIHHLGVPVGDIEFRARTATDRVRVMICASFREKKGIPEGLRALGNALQSAGDLDCRVSLIGDGPQRAQVEEAVEAAGLQDRVDWRGVLPYDQVLKEMSAHHVLLQPSITAADGDSEGGAPVTLLDAQATGMPVVATRHADIPEYVLDGQSGLLVPERDPDALTEALRVILTDQGRWAAMGEAGREHVKAGYDARVQSAALEDIYSTMW